MSGWISVSFGRVSELRVLSMLGISCVVFLLRFGNTFFVVFGWSFGEGGTAIILGLGGAESQKEPTTTLSFLFNARPRAGGFTSSDPDP